MAAVQRISCVPVVKVFRSCIPAYRIVVLPVMLGVALDSLVVAPVLSHDIGMQTSIGSQPLPNIRVTLQTFELAVASAPDMTICALGRSVNSCVGS